jgi:hypothetical protein
VIDVTIRTGSQFGVVIPVERVRLCDAFISWLPKPETIERRQLNAIKLAKLALCVPTLD